MVSLSDILFDFGKAAIKAGAAQNINQLATILQEYPDRKILIEGHTDNVGSEEYNEQLSEKRAFAVMAQLISAGINPDFVEAHGYGETQPIVSNDTAEGRQKNRRVDIVILNKKE